VPPSPQPRLWPFLVGLAVVLSVTLTLRLRYLDRVHEERSGAGSSRAVADSIGSPMGRRFVDRPPY
jgi:hypothetical protein